MFFNHYLWDMIHRGKANEHVTCIYLSFTWHMRYKFYVDVNYETLFMKKTFKTTST